MGAYNLLSSDELIYNLLTTAKTDGNPLLEHFHISYPDKTIMRESNSIYVAVVSTEPSMELFDSTEYRDLVEILVSTKIKDYRRAVNVIKTVIREIIRILKTDAGDDFNIRPVIRNIAPEYNPNFVLNKGHIMVEVITEIEDTVDSETIGNVCKILTEDIEVE